MNIGGVDSKNLDTRAFIYLERGVYRPGDSINLTAIIRDKDNTFTDEHPVN